MAGMGASEQPDTFSRLHTRWMLLTATVEVVLLAGFVWGDRALAGVDRPGLSGAAVLLAYLAMVWTPAGLIYAGVLAGLHHHVIHRLPARFHLRDARRGDVRESFAWAVRRGILAGALAGAVVVTHRVAGDAWPYPAVALLIAYECLATTCRAPLVGSEPFLCPEPLHRFAVEQGVEDLSIRVQPSGEGDDPAPARYQEPSGRPTIFLADQVVETISPTELIAVFAHELGHHGMGHVRQDTIVRALTHVALVLCLWPILEHFVPDGRTARAAIRTVPIVLATAWALRASLSPVQLALQRRQERQAHGWALQATRDPGAYLSAMRKVAEMTCMTGEPTWWEKAFFVTHPSLAEVEAQTRRWAKENAVPLRAGKNVVDCVEGMTKDELMTKPE